MSFKDYLDIISESEKKQVSLHKIEERIFSILHNKMPINDLNIEEVSNEIAIVLANAFKIKE